MRHVIAAGLIALAAGAAQAEERRALIEVAGLYCASCPYIAAQALQSVESVRIAGGIYDPQAQMARFVVIYDDALTTPRDLAAIPTQYGYPARVLPDEELARFEQSS